MLSAGRGAVPSVCYTRALVNRRVISGGVGGQRFVVGRHPISGRARPIFESLRLLLPLPGGGFVRRSDSRLSGGRADFRRIRAGLLDFGGGASRRRIPLGRASCRVREK